VPFVLFHQNMRQYASDRGAGRSDRTRAYLGERPVRARRPRNYRGVPLAQGTYGFPAVFAALPAGDEIAVAGFTELTSQAGTVGAVERFAGQLMRGGVGHVAVFNCGSTVGGDRGGISEYLGLAIARAVQLLELGRISMQGYLLPPAVECEPEPFACPWRNEIPPLASGDYRFVCYAVVQLPQQAAPIAVGFLHNTLKLGSRYVMMQRLPLIAQWIRASTVATLSVVYLGGDFNAEPPRPPRPTARFPLYPYVATLEPNTPMRFPGGAAEGTTWGGNTYDWWVADIPGQGGLPVASISALTRDGRESREGLMSDHVAIMLTLP
jgi:hypothetical protein